MTLVQRLITVTEIETFLRDANLKVVKKDQTLEGITLLVNEAVENAFMAFDIVRDEKSMVKLTRKTIRRREKGKEVKQSEFEMIGLEAGHLLNRLDNPDVQLAFDHCQQSDLLSESVEALQNLLSEIAEVQGRIKLHHKILESGPFKVQLAQTALESLFAGHVCAFLEQDWQANFGQPLAVSHVDDGVETPASHFLLDILGTQGIVIKVRNLAQAFDKARTN